MFFQFFQYFDSILGDSNVAQSRVRCTKVKWMHVNMCLKNSLSSFTMLRTDNIAWRKFCSLSLKIVKEEKGKTKKQKEGENKTKNWPNSNFSHNFCHWL